MKYTKTTYQDGTSPFLSAANLNKAESQIELLSKLPVEPGVFYAGGSTGANYALTVQRTAAPDADEPLLLFLIRPTISNSAGLTVTPSWGSNAYPVYDAVTGSAIKAGVLRANRPVLLLFDRTQFWAMAGGSCMPAGKITAGKTAPGSVTGLSAGDIYIYCPTMG